MIKARKAEKNKRNVLVCVIKNKNDLAILLRKRWYRIPVKYAPRKQFEYIAFYQPAKLDEKGKRIECFAKVSKVQIKKRIRLLPDEAGHPNANDDYLKIEFRKIRRLSRPIINIVPRRVSFGFTSLNNLRSARNILELYDILPTEDMVAKRLEQSGIKTVREFPFSRDGKRCRIDIAIIRRKNNIAIECDNYKAHRSKAQLRKDKEKDAFLRRFGWNVIRLKERDILANLGSCIKEIRSSVRSLPRRSMAFQGQ